MNVEAAREEDTGPIVSAVAVESNAANLHLICESPLFKKDRAIVPMEAFPNSRRAIFFNGSIEKEGKISSD